MNEIFDELLEFLNRIRLLILTSLSDNEIRSIENEAYDITFDFLMDYGINISVIIKNEIEFNYWLGALPFYNKVRDEGGE